MTLLVILRKLQNKKNKEEVTELVIKNINTKNIEKNNVQKNLGYSILKTIYKELDISNFLNNKQKKIKDRL